MIPFCEIIIIFFTGGPGRRHLLSPQWGMAEHTEILRENLAHYPSFILCSDERHPLSCQSCLRLYLSSFARAHSLHWHLRAPRQSKALAGEFHTVRRLPEISKIYSLEEYILQPICGGHSNKDDLLALGTFAPQS